jgi:hypothetical protein
MPHSSPVSSFDEPFEEEYARLIPSKPGAEREVVSSARATVTGQEGGHRSESEPQTDNLDIPAFMRRPVT